MANSVEKKVNKDAGNFLKITKNYKIHSEKRERTRPRNEIKRTEFELHYVFYYNGKKDKLDTFARKK